nr:hypothetical protein [uncultured Albidiferax sp.]
MNPAHRRPARVILSVIAPAMLFIAGYGLLWGMSSSSLAFVECSGTYSLFAANARCRQPAFAALMFYGGLLLAVVACVVVWKLRRRHG